MICTPESSTFPIDELIARFGATTYLAGLRNQLAAGQFTRPTFCLAAAQVYLSINKPYRALSVLWYGLLDHSKFPKENDSQQYTDCIEAACMRAKLHPPLCALNMIVKNEAKNIGGALDSIDDLMDEVVICDTGSIDTTCDIAALYGCRIINRKWNDNFSEARNSAIDGTAAQYILWMDADDRFVASSKNDLQKLLSENTADAALFNIANKTGGRIGNEFMQVRLFPRRSDIRFERRIHEQVMLSCQRAGVRFLPKPEIRIVHTGYDDPQTHRQKALRNLLLLREELKTNSSDPALLVSIGDCHVIIGDANAAIAAYSTITKNVKVSISHTDIYTHAQIQIGNLLRLKGDLKAALTTLTAAWSIDSTRIEAALLCGIVERQRHNIDAALPWFIAAVRTIAPARTTVTDSKMIKIRSLCNIAEILTDRADYSQLIELLKPAMSIFPEVIDFYGHIGKAYCRLNRGTEALRSFTKSLQLSPRNNPLTYEGLVELYITIGDIDGAKRCAQAAAERSSYTPLITQLLENSNRIHRTVHEFDEAVAVNG